MLPSCTRDSASSLQTFATRNDGAAASHVCVSSLALIKLARRWSRKGWGHSHRHDIRLLVIFSMPLPIHKCPDVDFPSADPASTILMLSNYTMPLDYRNVCHALRLRKTHSASILEWINMHLFQTLPLVSRMRQLFYKIDTRLFDLDCLSWKFTTSDAPTRLTALENGKSTSGSQSDTLLHCIAMTADWDQEVIELISIS